MKTTSKFFFTVLAVMPFYAQAAENHNLGYSLSAFKANTQVLNQKKSNHFVGTSVQKVDDEVVQDATSPITSDISNANVETITAQGDAVFPTYVPRVLQYHISDLPTLRDFGMELIPNTGSQDINTLNSIWSSFNAYSPIILPTGAHWPDNAYVPILNPVDSASIPIVTSFGRLGGHRPGYNFDEYGIGVPYYGNGVPSFTHDDADFTFSRVDSGGIDAKSYVPLAVFESVIDTQKEGGKNGTAGNQNSLISRMFTTSKSQGTIGNFNAELYSGGLNYYGGMDVNKWSHTVSDGTNWIWDNIQELYEGNPYYCNPQESNVCSVKYMNEEDMYGVGPGNPQAQYDPIAGNRMMFWLTTNHNINYNSSEFLRWSSNETVFRYRIMTKKDASGKEWMFYGLNQNYNPEIGTISITGSISGSTLTVTHTTGVISGDMRIWNNDLQKEVEIVSQKTGEAGGIGTYELSDLSSETTDINIESSDFNASGSAVFGTTGKTEPAYVFQNGKTFTDGTVIWTCIGTWQYDLETVIKVGGSNDPENGYIERIGTLMTEETDYIYNAIFDFSKAAFDPEVTHVFARMQKDMYIDLTADGTKEGQNNHLLGYDSNNSSLEYDVGKEPIFTVNDTNGINAHSLGIDSNINFSRKNYTDFNSKPSLWIMGTTDDPSTDGSNAAGDFFVNRYGDSSTLSGVDYLDQPFSITREDGKVHINDGLSVSNGTDVIGGIKTDALSVSGSFYLGVMTKTNIFALNSPVEGQKVFDTTDHEELTYRCPSATACGWFPVLYGAALTQ